MTNATLLIIRDGQYKEAVRRGEKLIVKSGGETYNLADILNVGVPETLHESAKYDVAQNAPGYLGHEEKGDREKAHKKAVSEALDKVMQKVETLNEKLGVPFFAADLAINPHKYETKRGFDPCAIIGPGHDMYNHYHYDIELKLQPCVKAK